MYQAVLCVLLCC